MRTYSPMRSLYLYSAKLSILQGTQKSSIKAALAVCAAWLRIGHKKKPMRWFLERLEYPLLVSLEST